MRVNVRLFARLRDIAGAGELVRELPGGATVRTVWEALAAEFPAMAAYASSVSSAVNADYARMDAKVNDGDEVAFLPPVSGGSGLRTEDYGPLGTETQALRTTTRSVVHVRQAEHR